MYYKKVNLIIYQQRIGLHQSGNLLAVTDIFDLKLRLVAEEFEFDTFDDFLGYSRYNNETDIEVDRSFADGNFALEQLANADSCLLVVVDIHSCMVDTELFHQALVAYILLVVLEN